MGPPHTAPHHCGAQLPQVGCLTLPRGLVSLSGAPWGPGGRDTGRASCKPAGLTCTPSCLLPHGWIRFWARKRGAPSQPWGPPGALLGPRCGVRLKAGTIRVETCAAPRGTTLREASTWFAGDVRGVPGGDPGSGASGPLSAWSRSERPVSRACKEKLAQRGPEHAGLRMDPLAKPHGITGWGWWEHHGWDTPFSILRVLGAEARRF